MLAALSFLSCVFMPFICSSVSPATGKPLQSDSPGPVLAVPCEDVVLPCHSAPHVRRTAFTAVEWSRVDGPSPLTVHAERDGEELVKEKAAKYVGRTAATGDGSLKLLGVTQQDNGIYRCVLLRGAATEDEVLVSLIVGEVPEVNVVLQRTPANDMLVRLESSGWILKPQMSLLDAKRTELHARTETALGPDSLYSVRAQVDAAATTETGAIIYRVEIPGTSVWTEKRILITDEFIPPEADLRRYVVLAVIVVLIFVLAVVVFVVPMEKIETLRTSLKCCIGYGHVSIGDQPGPSSCAVKQLYISEYGDITQISTTGSSQQIPIKRRSASPAEDSGQRLTGVKASHALAKKDLEGVKTYKEELISVGNKLGVHPALIAAIISRQSRFGTVLGLDGYGRSDSSSFGLMQINKHYHAVKGGPYSEEHLDQGVTFLIQLIKTMERKKQTWTKEQRLKGALACYVSGEEAVLPLLYEDLDSVTPLGDFSNDVVARAQWFAQNAF